MAVLVLETTADDHGAGLVGVGGLLASGDDVGERELAFESGDLSDRTGGDRVGSCKEMQGAGAGERERHEHHQ